MSQDAVIDAMVEQLGCYQRLAKLAELQHEHVRQSRTDQLLELLKTRQEVLEQAWAFERVVAPVKSRWSDYLAGLDETKRERAESLLAQTLALLERITAADRDDALVLQQRKLNLGKQINQATSARQLNRAYTIAAYGRPRSHMDVQR